MPAVHEWVITGAYGLFSLLSLAEVLALRRVGPSGQKTGPLPTLLIAGKNGEDWLRDATPLLKEEGFRIYYYDLESSDKSIKVAREQGVTVLTGRPPKDAVPLCWRQVRIRQTSGGRSCRCSESPQEGLLTASGRGSRRRVEDRAISLAAPVFLTLLHSSC